MKRLMMLSLVGLLALGSFQTSDANDQKKKTPAVDRARRTGQMLDDLYKTAIVLVTTHYVEEDSDLAAGDAFQALFKVMKDKGYHEVRLLDASGEAYDDDNLPRKGFEQAAVKALLAGAKTYEKVIKKDGKRYLQYATPIPVVMEKCIMCHENYRDLPKGQIIGSLSYTIPID
ncbi:MAG: hypothetical protein COB12_12400 [Flavobacterium sp.]|nr:DUF3365 domain-containing protein [Planctomycetaceae bacterium]PHS61077.1 MAG: hypothetical protein COB12_12400 [Flavobacterium sp.]